MAFLSFPSLLRRRTGLKLVTLGLTQGVMMSRAGGSAAAAACFPSKNIPLVHFAVFIIPPTVFFFIIIITIPTRNRRFMSSSSYVWLPADSRRQLTATHCPGARAWQSARGTYTLCHGIVRCQRVSVFTGKTLVIIIPDPCSHGDPAGYSR